MKKLVALAFALFLIGGWLRYSPYAAEHEVKPPEVKKSTGIPAQLSVVTELPYHGIREIDILYILKDVGHFLIYGSISNMEYHKMVKAWDLFESKKIKHVVVHLNSGGGEIFSGMAMAQLMRQKIAQGWTIEVKAQGLIASAAMRILVSGSHGKRMVSPYALLMVHELTTYTYRSSDSTTDKRKQAKILKMIQDNGTQYMSEMTGMPFEKLALMREEETWFSALEAVEMGFADGLLDFAPGGEE